MLGNNKNIFTKELTTNKDQLNVKRNFNENVSPNGSKPSKQSKLNLSKLQKPQFQENFRTNSTHSTEFFYLPVPKPVIKKVQQQPDISIVELKSNNNTISKIDWKTNARNLITISGKVDFCIKMRKLYPDVNVIWNVYGKKKVSSISFNSKHIITHRSNC